MIRKFSDAELLAMPKERIVELVARGNDLARTLHGRLEGLEQENIRLRRAVANIFGLARENTSISAICCRALGIGKP